MKRGPKPRKLPVMIAQQIITRYQAGEIGTDLCSEYHIGYDRFRNILAVHSVKIRPYRRRRRTKDTRERCRSCGIILEECEDWERALERDGLCGGTVCRKIIL